MYVCISEANFNFGKLANPTITTINQNDDILSSCIADRTGLEPVPTVLETAILPLNYQSVCKFY